MKSKDEKDETEGSGEHRHRSSFRRRSAIQGRRVLYDVVAEHFTQPLHQGERKYSEHEEVEELLAGLPNDLTNFLVKVLDEWKYRIEGTPVKPFDAADRRRMNVLLDKWEAIVKRRDRRGRRR